MTIKKKIAAVAVAICTSLFSVTAFAGETFQEEYISPRESRSIKNAFDVNGFNYGMETTYDIGSSNIFDNPSIVAKAGAEPLKQRYVYATLTELSSGETVTQDDESSNAIGSGVKYISVKAKHSGTYGTGYGHAKVYDGPKPATSNLVGEQRLNVEE